MKMNNIFKTGIFAMAAFALVACGDSFLDTMPDNRTEIDNQDKVVSLLVSAYPTHDYQMITEYMSDNVDDYSTSSPNTSRYLEEVYFWKDVTESNNESPENYWQGEYLCIATANQALQAIDKIVAESGWTQTLHEAQAEALMCRAYAHFMLVNIFAKNYNSQTASTDPGITIMLEPETTLNPQYQRNTVAECYEAIQKDIEAALPYVGSSYYKIPKYHFNESAANAFAARFYLYYEKWDKAIEYANKVLGTNPKTVLRDYAAVGAESTCLAAAQVYIDAKSNANLLLATAYSYMGNAMSNYSTWKRFAHIPYLSANETALAPHPWGTISATDYYAPLKTYNSTSAAYHIFWRVPYLFEYTDAVAGTGYRHTIFPLFTTDEALLNRAEAYIHLQQYQKACDDLNLWVSNFVKTGATEMTPESIQEFYEGVSYCYENVDGEYVSTPKKHLHPAFSIDAEGSIQESMFQALLNARRLEQLAQGMRWFDVKRFGIVIPRRTCNAAGAPEKYIDWLEVDDPRRAVQIPQKVRDAGYEPNSRASVITSNAADVPTPDPETDTE